MTKLEMKIVVSAIQVLARHRDNYVSENKGKITGRSGGAGCEPYVSAAILANAIGANVVTMRQALRGCQYMVAKTGSSGGYKLRLAPEVIKARALKIKKRNNKTSPNRWVRKVELTVEDVIGAELSNVMLGVLPEIGDPIVLVTAFMNELAAIHICFFDVHNY